MYYKMFTCIFSELKCLMNENQDHEYYKNICQVLHYIMENILYMKLNKDQNNVVYLVVK